MTVQEVFKTFTFMVTFAFDAFILSAGKTRPHNSAYYILQLSAWLLQRVACPWRHGNVLKQQTDKTNSKNRCANTIQILNTGLMIDSNLSWPCLNRFLSLQQGGLCASHCDRQRIPRCHAVRSTLFQCVFGYWSNRFDQISVEYIPHGKYIHSCCIFMHVYMLANWTWFHVGIPGAIPFPALRI